MILNICNQGAGKRPAAQEKNSGKLSTWDIVMCSKYRVAIQ